MGLKEIVDEEYLRYRLRTNEYIGERLVALEVPIVRPVGGHAVFIDARRWLPHIPARQYPGQALAVALYEYGGIRACEIGTVMFGKRPDGSEVEAPTDLVRLAMPRRVYTQSHADYIIEVFEELRDRRQTLRGFKINWQPERLRHFTARFEPLPLIALQRECQPEPPPSPIRGGGLKPLTRSPGTSISTDQSGAHSWNWSSSPSSEPCC